MVWTVIAVAAMNTKNIATDSIELANDALAPSHQPSTMPKNDEVYELARKYQRNDLSNWNALLRSIKKSYFVPDLSPYLLRVFFIRLSITFRKY